jgi:dTDP-4-amino-4,6-dideoxygalactose transaminase
VHVHPFYRDKYGWKPHDFRVAFGEYQREVSIPLHPSLSAEDIADVIAAVTDVVKSNAVLKR